MPPPDVCQGFVCPRGRPVSAVRGAQGPWNLGILPWGSAVDWQIVPFTDPGSLHRATSCNFWGGG